MPKPSRPQAGARARFARFLWPGPGDDRLALLALTLLIAVSAVWLAGVEGWVG